MVVRHLPLVLVAVLTLMAQQPAAVIEIPFSFSTKQPIVQAKVNDTDAVPFVIDTGASINVIDVGLVQSAGVALGAGRPTSGGGQGTVPTQSARGLTFQIAGASWPDQNATAVALGYPKTKHFAGLIGAPILMRYAAQFQFDKGVLRLIDPASYAPPAGAITVPFELQEDLPIVHVTIDAGTGPIDARLMVDTGASQFVDLNRPFVEAHKLVEAVPDAAARQRPAAIGTPAPFLNGTAKRVVIGGVPFDRPRLGLSQATSGSSARAERDGIIGNDLLRHFTVTVDYRRKILVLQKTP
jgi:Aspartyl protease